MWVAAIDSRSLRTGPWVGLTSLTCFSDTVIGRTLLRPITGARVISTPGSLEGGQPTGFLWRLSAIAIAFCGTPRSVRLPNGVINRVNHRMPIRTVDWQRSVSLPACAPIEIKAVSDQRCRSPRLSHERSISAGTGPLPQLRFAQFVRKQLVKISWSFASSRLPYHMPGIEYVSPCRTVADAWPCTIVPLILADILGSIRSSRCLQPNGYRLYSDRPHKSAD